MGRRFWLLPLLAALVLAGCGGGDDEAATTTQGNGESALLADAAAATTQAQSSRVSLVASVGGRRLTGQGAYDFRAERGTLGVDLGALDEGLGEADLVVSDHVLYYHLPAGLGLVAGGKNWVKVDLQTLGEATGTNLGPLAQGNPADPGRYLEWLKASGADVEEVGSESVRGVETEHYRATVDLDKVAEIAPPEAREATKALIERLKSELDVDAVTVDAWVDDDGLVRRIRQEYELDSTRTEITLELYDFGVKVEAKAPSPDDVVDLGDSLQGGFGQ